MDWDGSMCGGLQSGRGNGCVGRLLSHLGKMKDDGRLGD